MTTRATRQHQMFPLLNPAQVETARRFASGPERRFALYAIGEQGVPSWLVPDGGIEVSRRHGLNNQAYITYHAGQFSGEINQLRNAVYRHVGGRAAPEAD